MILTVGADQWPLPIPIVQSGGAWRYDTRAGAEELINRRIGRNEIAAIRTVLTCVDAQKAYFTSNGEYAQRFLSTPGKHDGLYWPPAAGEPESPLAARSCRRRRPAIRPSLPRENRHSTRATCSASYGPRGAMRPAAQRATSRLAA